MFWIYLIFPIIVISSCKDATYIEKEMAVPVSSESKPESTEIIKYKVEIVDTFEHNTNYYTQGLTWFDGCMYEGTGNLNESKLIKYNNNNKVEKIIPIDDNFFGEGITVFNNQIYQLTWLNGRCLVYDLKTLKLIKEFTYSGEGWGITNNDSLLIISDGTDNLRFISPTDFRLIKNLKVTYNGKTLGNINELELVGDILYANIYFRDIIVMIDIKSGKVIGEIDIKPLRKHLKDNPKQEVSNGIAYIPQKDEFILTGKNWNKFFLTKFVEIK